ncbi:MAG: glycosyl hydrolase [Bacteroidetes bacterium]|nr:glycosyl hydrolase [Bacteroidota bacterium]
MKTGKLLLAGLLLATATAGVAQSDVNSSTFGTLEARVLGPGTMSGRISAIEGVNSENGKTLYVGTAGGGVWKTTNAGASFKPIFDKYCQSIGAIAIDQKNPKIVYVGTGESNMRNSVSIGDGLYKSTDAGSNWVKIGGLDSTEHISKVLIDPNNSSIVYAAAPGPLWSDSKHRGLYKSTDAGKTFEKILYVSEKAGCADLVIDPSNPSTLYASTWEFRRTPYSFSSGGPGSAVWKSTDGGKTWKELTNGLPAKPIGRTALAIAPSAPNNLIAIVEAKQTRLYISADAGESWKSQSASLNVVSRPFYFSTLVIDPKDPKRVYRPAYSFAYSSDGGYSFAEASGEGGWVHSDHHALWINPNNTNQLYLGTDGGVYLSLDRGATWLFVQNLPVGQFYHVDHDMGDPYRVFGGLQDNGSWVAPSSNAGGVGNGDWKAIYGGDGFWVTPDPTDPHIAYAESQGGDVNRVDLRTVKSVGVRPLQTAGDEKLRWNWNTPIVIGKANPKNLYTGAQYLYRSKDQGRNWTKISPDLTTNDKKKQEQENSGGLSADNTSAENHTTIFTIAESPLDENMIWVGTDDGNLQVSTDGGATWTNTSGAVTATGIPAQTWVSSIQPSQFNKQVVYATFDNHMYGDHTTYAAKSDDGGKTWKAFQSKEFSGFAHKIIEDPQNKQLLFIGTEMGLFASLNGGADWFRMKNNIPWYALVRDLKIHPRTHDLMIATHGRGILIVDDISAMRNLTPDILSKEIHLFETGDIELSTGRFGDGGFPNTGGWVAPNAPSLKPFQYYLKDRFMSGAIKLEIYDEAGKLVQSVPGTNRKGINRVTWSQRMMPPKTATGATKPNNGGAVAPQVLPGKYTLKLKAGSNELTQSFNMVHVEKSAFTLSERKAQFSAAMELYELHQQLAVVVADLAAKQKEYRSSVDSIKNKKLQKTGNEYITALETLRAELIPTKQTSIFADESRLREDITQVYLAICFNEAGPSNLQLESIKNLKQRVRAAEEKAKQLHGQFEEKLKQAIAKEKK